MTGLDAFEIYKSIRLHFDQSSSYDYFKSSGKITKNPRTFSQRHDKPIFEKIANNLTRKELVDYMVSNVVSQNTPMWIGDLNMEGSEEAYIKWLARKESLSYHFKDEVDKLKDLGLFWSGFKPLNNEIPKVVQMYFKKEISMETLTILECLCSFMGNQKDIICSDLSFTIKRYVPFLNPDLNKFREVLKEKVL